MLTKVLFGLTLYVTNMISPVTQQTCESHRACNPGKNVDCGICVDNLDYWGSPGKRECQFIFDYKYPGKNARCEQVKKCPKGCSSNGECRIGKNIIMPYCACNNTHYGVDCGSRTPAWLANKFPARGFGLTTSHLPSTAYSSLVRFEISCNRDHRNLVDNPSKEMTFTVVHDRGFYFRNIVVLQPPSERWFCRFSDKYNTHAYVTFPFFSYRKRDIIDLLTLGNTVIGYVSTVTATFEIMKPRFTFWTYNWKVLVYYGETYLRCIADISLYGCGSSREKSLTYYKYQAVNVASLITYLEDGSYKSTTWPKSECARGARMSWSVWRETDKGLNQKERPEYETFQEQHFTADRHTLKLGYYWAQFEVRNVQVNSVARNTMSCFFNVKALPLIARIYGGSERTVRKSLGIVLSCKGSWDRNSKANAQSGVFATWYCEDMNNLQNRPSFCEPVTLKLSDVYYISGDRLNYGSKFKFYLKVWTQKWDWCKGKELGCEDVSPQFASVVINISEEKEEEEDSILIQCIRNCEEKVMPNQQLILKAVSSSRSEMKDLEWYVIVRNTEKLDVSDIAVDNLPPALLVLKEYTLEMGEQYVVEVKTASITNVAKYTFVTHTIKYGGNCTVHPESGFKGNTSFNINCDPGDAGFIFDFYNKNPEESVDGLMFSGRMLGSSTTGQLLNVELTRQKVLVYIVNQYGLSEQRSVDVVLDDYSVSEKDLAEVYSDLDRVVSEGNHMETLKYLSFIPDIVSDSIDKSQVLDRLISTISSMPIKFFPEVKMTTSTLNNIVVGLNKPTRVSFKPKMMVETLALTRQLASSLSYLVSGGDSFQSENSPKELLKIAEVQLDTLSNLLVQVEPVNATKEPYIFDSKDTNDLKKSSIHAEATLAFLQDALAFIQSPGQPPVQISSSNKDFVMWVAKNDADFPISDYLDNKIPVSVISGGLESLVPELDSKDTISLQVSTMKENIFSWYKSDVKSNLVSVAISRETVDEDMIKIDDISKPIDVRIKLDDNVERLQVTDKMRQPDPTLNPVDLDHSVKVHRLDPKVGSLTSIEFLYPPTKHKLRVLLETEFRPDYDRMLHESDIISKESPVYLFPLIHRYDYNFLYIGILPAADVPVNEEVLYSFKVDSKLCQHWAQGHWSSSGCEISLASTGDNVICSCHHFSIFSAAFPVPPQEIDPFADAYLLLTIHKNPLVFVVVLIFLLVYFLLCLWAWHKDKLDRYQRNVIILEDNFPGDKFPYLIAVYTSSRFNSGTTANVGIHIIGSLSNSRVHILSSKSRKLLRKNSDDWFLIYCPEPLGDLECIHIWHDNAGSNPDWHMDKIIVFSLLDNTETVFVFEQWLSLRGSEYPEALVRPFTRSDVTSFKRMFLDNCVFGLRETHILLSVIFRHPRSEVSRLQRISTLVVGIMVAMLCSIMFYVPDENLGVDDPEYDVSSRDFYISIQTMVLSVIATILIFFAFKRSYKIVKSEICTDTEEKEDEENKGEKSMYEKFVKYVSKTLKTQPLNPVQLPYSEPLIIVRQVWLTIAWVMCVAVILISSYFVILYGLKLGAVQSKKWLTSLALTVGEDVFVQGPGKIMLISVILSLALQRVCKVDTHRISLTDVRDLEVPNDDRYLEKLLETRSHPMYAPLRSDAKSVIMEKKQFYHNCWLTIDFTISLLFVINVCSAIFHLWSSHYYANSQVVRLLTSSYHPEVGSINFFKVRNIQDLESFFQQTLIRSLYTANWYNEQSLEDPTTSKQYWNSDFVHKMLGLPMLRQLKVYPKSCNNLVLDGKQQCIPVWSYSVEDNDIYGPGWRIANYDDMNKDNSPWIYKDRSTSKTNTLYRLYGASGRLYDNGGFSVTLGPMQEDTERTIAELLDRHWQNLLTKVVFLELTLYNFNQDVFSQATLTVEYLISGCIELKAQATSVEGKLQLSTWNVLFILFFLFYVVRAANTINRAGLLDYMKTVRNVTRLIVLVLCVLCFITATLHSYLSVEFHSEFQQQTVDSYFDFDYFFFHFSNLKLVASLLFCVAVVRMMILFRGGRIFLNHVYTMKLSWNWILWLTVMTFGLLVLILHLTYLFNIFGGHRDFQLVINKQISRYLTTKEMNSLKVQVFYFLKVVCLALIRSSYLIIFIHNAKIAKTHNKKPSDDFSFFTFFFSLISPKKCRRRPKPNSSR